MEEEKREHKMKMKKMEKEMESVFDTKVKEKRNRLKESQKDLERKHENVRFTLSLKISLFFDDISFSRANSIGTYRYET